MRRIAVEKRLVVLAACGASGLLFSGIALSLATLAVVKKELACLLCVLLFLHAVVFQRPLPVEAQDSGNLSTWSRWEQCFNPWDIIIGLGIGSGLGGSTDILISIFNGLSSNSAFAEADTWALLICLIEVFIMSTKRLILINAARAVFALIAALAVACTLAQPALSFPASSWRLVGGGALFGIGMVVYLRHGIRASAAWAVAARSFLVHRGLIPARGVGVLASGDEQWRSDLEILMSQPAVIRAANLARFVWLDASVAKGEIRRADVIVLFASQELLSRHAALVSSILSHQKHAELIVLSAEEVPSKHMLEPFLLCQVPRMKKPRSRSRHAVDEAFAALVPKLQGRFSATRQYQRRAS